MRVPFGIAAILRGLLGATLAISVVISLSPSATSHGETRPRLLLSDNCVADVMAAGASEWEAIGYCAAAFSFSDAAVLAYQMAAGLTQATEDVIENAIEVAEELVESDVEETLKGGVDAAGRTFDVLVAVVGIVFSNPARLLDAKDLRDSAAEERDRSQQTKEDAQEVLLAILLRDCPAVALRDGRIAQRAKAVNEALQAQTMEANGSEATLEFLTAKFGKLLKSETSNACSGRSQPARLTATSTPQRAVPKPRGITVRPTSTRMPIPEPPAPVFTR